MAEKSLRPLKIEPQFKNLIRPLQRKEYLQLEQNILSEGCRDPIILWNGVIVDGHNRYEICMRHQMLIEYNGKKKNPAQRLSMNKLHARESSIFSGLEDSTAPDEEWAGDSETEEDSVF